MAAHTPDIDPGCDVAYIWGADLAGVEEAASAHLEGVSVRRVDLRDGLEALAHAARSGGLFGPVGVWAAGAGALRAADAKALAAACSDGVRVALIADRAAPGWLTKSLSGRVQLHDCSIPKGNGFAGWVRSTARSMGLEVGRDAADVIAAAAAQDPGRARSVLWVCAVTGVNAPSAAAVARIVEGWTADTHAFAALDAALDGDRVAAVTKVDGLPAPMVAAALRTAARRAAQLEGGDGDAVPRFARRALQQAARRGVDAAALGAHTVTVEVASRSDADAGSLAAAALAEIAAAPGRH